MNAIVAHPHAAGTPGTARMKDLERLPVFFALQGKRALVAGGSAGAAWKAELLSAAGARVHVYAAQVSEELLAVAAAAPHGSIVLHARDWIPEDLSGAAIAVGACQSDAEAEHFASATRAAGVPVNVIDKPNFSDFAFGAIVNRSPLVIGISTDGTAPVFAQAIRGKIEALIPAGFAFWVEAARRWRAAVKDCGLSFAGRRRFWQLFTAHAMSQPEEAPEQSHYEAFLTEVVEAGVPPDRGSITLIDVATGEADLLTLRAARALQAADVVLFDEAVPNEILDFARREASKISIAPTELRTAAPLLSLALAGKRVVRLRYGACATDNSFETCRAAGIPVRLVPSGAMV